MNQDIQPVLDEISAMLKKHDMAGLVLVANASHCDYRMVIDPSWSCAWFEQVEDQLLLRIRSQRTDYATKEAQKKHLEATIGTFVTFNDVMAELTETNNKILVRIAEDVEFLGRSTREDG